MTCDDYCNNHGCNRGPGCPAGGGCHAMPGCKDTACPGHPGVASIGKKMRGADPRPSIRRAWLGALARAMLLCIAVMLISALTVAAIDAWPQAQRKIPSKCAKLLDPNQAGGAPAHIQIKCGTMM